MEMERGPKHRTKHQQAYRLSGTPRPRTIKAQLVRYIYADSMDHVDPGYDFLADRPAPTRNPYWDDAFPHEIMGYAPYDGVLVSRGIVGDHRVSGKYSEAQAMRFRRVGARQFFRLDEAQFAGLSFFGDCGAFT